MSRLKTAAAGAAGLLLAAAGSAPALAQGAPPSWDTLTRCAAMPADDARLACYDTAMRAAGYAPNPQAVTAERHKTFGLPIPKLNLHRERAREAGEQAAAGAAAPTAEAAAPRPAAPAPAAPQEDENHIQVTLQQVATILNGKLLLVMDDGAIWEQTDTTAVLQPPKPGQTMTIHKELFGGYFCDISKYQSVRCKRTH